MDSEKTTQSAQTRALARAERDAPASSLQRRANGHDVRGQLAHNAQFKAQMIAQMRGHSGCEDTSAVLASAAQGVQGSGGALPYIGAIQRSFGHHDVTRVQAFVGGQAKTASDAIGAEAYATGNSVAFRDSPTLHTAAHEAAHIVQQRAGVQLSGGVGQVGDKYECHADAVADRVVQGKSAADLLDQFTGMTAPAEAGVQRKAAVQRKKHESTMLPQVVGQPFMKGCPFLWRAQPAAAVWFKAEKALAHTGAMQDATNHVEALLIGQASIHSVRGAGMGAVGKATNPNRGLPKSGDAILAKKWQFYVFGLGHRGRGLDENYNIVDGSGQVLNAWWAENMG